MKILIIGAEDARKYSKNMFLMQKIEEYVVQNPEFNIRVEFKSVDDLYNAKEEYDCCVFDEVSEYPVKLTKRGVNKPYYRSKERW